MLFRLLKIVPFSKGFISQIVPISVDEASHVILQPLSILLNGSFHILGFFHKGISFLFFGRIESDRIEHSRTEMLCMWLKTLSGSLPGVAMNMSPLAATGITFCICSLLIP